MWSPGGTNPPSCQTRGYSAWIAGECGDSFLQDAPAHLPLITSTPELELLVLKLLPAYMPESLNQWIIIRVLPYCQFIQVSIYIALSSLCEREMW